MQSARTAKPGLQKMALPPAENSKPGLSPGCTA